MIRGALRKVIGFLRSPGLGVGLLVFVGVWSMLATFIPQGDVSVPEVAAWASAHAAVEPVVRFLGLHQAFSAPLFRIGVFALAVATALCAWQRTKVALARTRTLKEAAIASEASVSAAHDLEIMCDPDLRATDVISRTADTLEHLGIRTKRRGDVLFAVSRCWAVWGSPVFHWGLVLLILAIFVGGLQRSEGLMGVAVGETKPDAPASYGMLRTGPLYDWSRVHRSIRVDAFDTEFRTGDLDRGPTPTVSVLDAEGRVIRTQRVYPNSPLQAGSLTIHPSDFGFAATLSVMNASGVEFGRATQLIDVSQTATEGTVPVGALTVSNQAGKGRLNVFATVPMDRSNGQLALPQERVARVSVRASDGRPVLDRVMRPGEEMALPTGDTLRLEDIGFYARLSVVDDPTTPLLYAAFAVAMMGLTLTVVARQQIVLATAVEGENGLKLVATLRLWRNVPTNRSEIESQLAKALRADKEDVS